MRIDLRKIKILLTEVCNLANACDFSVFTGAWMACSKGCVSFSGKEKHDRAAEKCGLI